MKLISFDRLNDTERAMLTDAEHRAKAQGHAFRRDYPNGWKWTRDQMSVALQAPEHKCARCGDEVGVDLRTGVVTGRAVYRPCKPVQQVGALTLRRQVYAQMVADGTFKVDENGRATKKANR